ncbi:Ion transport 2 domain protein [Chroococcidiopsis sp. CCALA 051]|uniref:potassium channel family protein n=1 Tax=Chroococcidiopsis sp. CCALA 051 TaxID=869949 RepID=UPI000D0D22B4|nr:potassium channel family protein [Chroococcidiopsis sp. CCALA 051]PSM49479.1 Ion transport 2 domain protein [Chroococcidiopsis sp. CCALA 051]
MDLLIQLAGTGIIILTLLDIYLTVLFHRLGSSVVSMPLNRGIWCFLRLVTQVIPSKSDRLLAHSGSIMIVAILAVWAASLMSGFALIIFPELGSAIQASEGKTPTDFITALYYSGFSFTTLGTGDLVPKTATYRLLTLLEAALGFSSFTITITYLLSVYNALITRNTFALSLYHRTDGTGDAAELLARLGASGELSGIQQDLSNMARDLIELLELQHSYPVLIYFRFRETYYTLPRVILLAIDTASLIKSALNAEKYRSLLHSTAVAELWGGSTHILSELSQSILPKHRIKCDRQMELVWRKRYYDAVERLSAEGIETATDREAGEELYVALRRKWQPLLTTLSNYLAVDL